MANLRYPAKTNLSWLVDNPIDTKTLFWISETTHLRSNRIPYSHFLNPIKKSYCWWLSLPIVDGYTRNPIPTHDDDPILSQRNFHDALSLAGGCRKFSGCPQRTRSPSPAATWEAQKSLDWRENLQETHGFFLWNGHIPPIFPLNQSNEVAAEFCLVYYQHFNQWG